MTNELTVKGIEKGLAPYMEQMKTLLPEKDLIREIAFASQAVMANDTLQKCSTESILKAVFNVATTGLSLNPVLKFAALTPRFVKGNFICVLSPMVQGLVKLTTDTGSVTSVYSYLVYEGDVFEPTLGTDVKIKHEPKFKSKEWDFVYAVGVLPDGSKMFEVMTKEEVFAVRESSETWKAFQQGKIKQEHCIWFTWEGEMARKTVIKRLVKQLPKTEKYNKLAEVINLDNSDHMASDNQSNYIESLVRTSTYDHDTQQMLIDKVWAGLTSSEASTMIQDLQNNQIDPIAAGNNYDMKDIKNKIDKHI